VEWSTNEKVATEGAAGAAISGLYSLVAMKNAGLSVALDFLTHLSMTGLGGGEGAMLLAVCDDPDGHSSGDETDSRWLARFSYCPLVEPSDIAEARELVRFAYELSREFSACVMLRSYTRLSHASSIIEPADIQSSSRTAKTDPHMCLTPYLAKPTHAAVLDRLEKIRKRFEGSKFNHYEGPSDAELVLVCSGSGVLCARDALELLGVEDRVGILKLATLWPFPNQLVARTLGRAKRVLVVEEVDPFVEVHVKSALAPMNTVVSISGRESGHIEAYGEITVDRVMGAVSNLLGLETQTLDSKYQQILDEEVAPLLIDRGLAWCPGCPHRASFYAIDKALKSLGRGGCFTGDIGCYTLDVFPGGKHQMNMLHAMGSGAGLACGLGQLKAFGYDQPVLSLCGDSTFFHAAIPALINAVHNGSSFLQIILDNSTTAMTGFQPHPGTATDAMGRSAAIVNLESLCQSIGCSVDVIDPFDIKGTIRKVKDLLNDQNGVRVLILRRQCELLRMKKDKAEPHRMAVDLEVCRGNECGVCLSQLRCPGLASDSVTGKTEIRGDICTGCGICAEICPFNAINKEENK
jgi:indolepyruvate ferredoxin oxidoreductase alpha subunit